MAHNTLSNRFHQNIIMHPKDAGKRIDVAINEQFEQFSRAQIQNGSKKARLQLMVELPSQNILF